MTRVGVVGATGYAGAELVRILSGHHEVELTTVTSRQFSGKRFDAVYPSMAGAVDLVCEKLSTDKICDKTDFIFIALPHKIPMEIVPEFIRRNKRVIDLSADFRFADVSRYESFYQPHTAKELLKKSVYGLSEIYHENIKEARLTGNPGCYPTSVLLPLIPLLKEKIIDPETIIADSKSGVSGAGRSLSISSLYSEANESFKPYKVTGHRHCPEIEEVLSAEYGKNVNITFVPHLVPMTRGMETTTYVNLTEKVSHDDIMNCFKCSYKGRRFIRLCPENRPPDTAHVRGTNYCDIGCKIDDRNNRLIIMSVIDNLIKGAAGQAVQNMNIMLGLDESTGLLNIPCPV